MISIQAFGRTTFLMLLSLCLLSVTELGSISSAQDLSDDSKKQDGVPQGKVEGPFPWNNSKIYPGTVRKYWVYVPAQYDPSKPTCSIIIQDGLGRAKGYRLPTVLDNLIHKKEVPPQIGIFIEPGVVPAPNKESQPRFNRSFEYDSMGDRYARFLIEEIIPEVGKKYNLSKDPNDRAIGGASSGGICAFTAAWERPDAFRRVFSTIGTYVGLRGGNEYPTIIRKFEPKPIRVYLQDGNNDLNIYGGDWWVANQAMLSSLKFAGYDVNHIWGNGGHDGRQAAEVTPDAMRWLWRDYPEPIQAGINKGKKRRTELLIPEEDWTLVKELDGNADGPAVNKNGEVFFLDAPNSKCYKVANDGKISLHIENTNRSSGLMFGPDGRLYGCQGGTNRIVRFSDDGSAEPIVEKTGSNDLVHVQNGIYYTDHKSKKVWYISNAGKRKLVDQGIEFPNGVVTSTDQTQLFVSDTRGRFIYVFQIQPDGSLKHKQRYGYLHIPAHEKDSGADGMTLDSKGRLYVTTRYGIQVLDQLGRVHFVIRRPAKGWITNCVFGGKDFDELYVTIGKAVYKRKLNAKGVLPFADPFKAPRPGL